MLLLARHLLSTQITLATGTRTEHLTINADYPFVRCFWRGIYYPRKVSIQMLHLTRCQLCTQSIRLNATFGEALTLHANYSCNWRSNGTSNYQRRASVRALLLARHLLSCKVSVQMLHLTRCQLSTQSIHLNATFAEAATIHANYSPNWCSNTTSNYLHRVSICMLRLARCQPSM